MPLTQEYLEGWAETLINYEIDVARDVGERILKFLRSNSPGENRKISEEELKDFVRKLASLTDKELDRDAFPLEEMMIIAIVDNKLNDMLMGR